MPRIRPAAPIHYCLRLSDPAAHLFEVELTVAAPAREGQRLALPAWIPGSYMIREFARHVVGIEASCGGRRVGLTKLDKHSWQAARCDGPLALRYRVYGWDLSVRSAHFDATHAFFNGTSVFLKVAGFEDQPCTVELAAPGDRAARDWKVATTLPRDGAEPFGFGRYRAANYAELIDHPVEVGAFTLAAFTACGTRHEVAITGRHDTDTRRLCRDLKRICETQIRVFEPATARAPFDRYLFLVTAVGDGYGGLEHRASTALICARNDLPHRGLGAINDGYRRFLGLASHEYFHSWNVKRIKPAAFEPYDLEKENYSRLLWIFEGFTSYYDDLMLVRSGVIDSNDYLKLLAATIGNVIAAPGRKQQSVAESSFDAWTKYYRQDEQSPNSIVSYYAKGALVGLALDLRIRIDTGGARSLDHVMRLMWRRFGRNFEHARTGLEENEFPALVEKATGIDLRAEIRSWAYGTADLPLPPLFEKLGIAIDFEPADASPSLGFRLANRGPDLAIATVYTGGPAHQAGMSAGDVLLAFDGLKVDERSLKSLLARCRAGQQVTLHAFRRDELMSFDARLAAAAATHAKLKLKPKVPAATARLRKHWLGK